MAITASTKLELSISHDGTTWLDFPKLANDMDIIPPSEFPTRLNGTAQIPLLWTLIFTWSYLKPQEFGQLYSLYQTGAQSLLLNYPAVSITAPLYTPETSWYYAPAVWKRPPEFKIVNRLYKDVRVQFDRVEWQGVANFA